MSGRPVIMWFSNDLRLADNSALAHAAESGCPLVCVYVLDDETPGGLARGAASRWWLERSLARLAQSLEETGGRLILRRGETVSALEALSDEVDAGAIHFSRGHAPWSAALESRLKDMAGARGIACRRFRGYLLHEPDAIRTGAGEPYKVYTPFSKACFAAEPSRTPAAAPDRLTFHAGAVTSDRLEDWRLYDGRPDWASRFGEYWTPGERGAREKLERFVSEAIGAYKDDRDRPDLYATSRLSPHLHFGEISPLQCWTAARHAMADGRRNVDRGAEHFLKELLWREFSYHLLHHWPDLPQEPFRPEFCGFPWNADDDALARWQQGMTGYPIVDAGMRELWATGWMHNRVRMIAASFLVKDLLVPWQDGERWFHDTLVDADIANNSASWQWVAGCGADAAPYFRIFNPVLQGEKFDPEGDYVRTWVPELKALPADAIYKPWDAKPAVLEKAGVTLGRSYPKPMVDHGKARDAALAAYDKIRKSAQATS